MCQLSPPEMPQVPPCPHSHSSTSNFPLAFLPCISGIALDWEGAAGLFEGLEQQIVTHLATHLALLTPCILLTFSWEPTGARL